MTDKETIQRLCDSVDALMSEKLHTRITKLEDKGVEQVIVDTIGPMLDRLTALEERNIGYKQDIVLLTQENSQMFERITELEAANKHQIDVDWKLLKRISALEKEMRYLQPAGLAKIYNGPS